MDSRGKGKGKGKRKGNGASKGGLIQRSVERQLPSVLEGAAVGAVGPYRGGNGTHHGASWLQGAELM